MGATGGAWRRPVAALVVTTGCLAGLSACSSSSGHPATASSSTPSFSPATASFSGSTPSGLGSLASSAQASVSAAVSSASSAAASFGASVSAAAAGAQASASAALATTAGSGNAIGDITLTGVPTSTTGGLTAVVVNITNSGSSAASYAVRIDFTDASGTLVDSDVVGAQNLGPGQRAAPVAVSTKSAGAALNPKVATAQRY
ncbi:hypothetical protein ABH930_005333 [Kitasatospora sp. GAS204A]|nr:hypothetical protein [Kitasatospora sp. GAS204B]